MVKQKNLYHSEYEYIEQIREYCNSVRLDKSVNTVVSYLSSMDRFFAWAKVKTFEDVAGITSTNCREYQAALKADGLQASSINAHIRILRALFNWLAENEMIAKSPLEKVKNLKTRKKMIPFLSLDEIRAILGACKNIEEKTMFSVFIATGLRRDELPSLKLKDRTGYNFLVKNGKGDKERIVSLPEDVYNLFLQYLEWRDKKYPEIEYVFVSRFRRRYCGEAIRAKFKAIMKRAGLPAERIEELSTHSLRHTFCANLIENGVDIKVAQIAMGHADLETTSRIYAHVRSSAVEKAMRSQKRIV